MVRNRASAKKAGSSFERDVADYLKIALQDDRIDRRVRNGALDKGDIANVRTVQGERVTIEVKNYGGQFKVTEWLNEVERERINDDQAEMGVVVAKRRGITSPAKQVVFMDLQTFAHLVNGKPFYSKVVIPAKEIGFPNVSIENN